MAAARLGGQVRFWGRAGDDAAGHAMVDELRVLGVDVSGLRLFPGARSSVSGILVDARGERSIVNFRGADLPRPCSTATWPSPRCSRPCCRSATSRSSRSRASRAVPPATPMTRPACGMRCRAAAAWPR
ncbi:carbohydrate kinase family protein [Piscinibacter sakaiensis]|uniref:carbohydrate kinase family protein n=1 Tax=Piscinibacter sakaiensis TaxID=1547922 RepID=UPI0037276A6F